MRNRHHVAFAGMVLSHTSIAGAVAGAKTFAPVDDANPGAIARNGKIDVNSGINFRRALQAAPEAKLVTLSSPGGNLQMGLLIADDLHQRELVTCVPKKSKCFSTCSFVFLAGDERKVKGALACIRSRQIWRDRSCCIAAHNPKGTGDLLHCVD